jgi:hypothetical protein
MGTYNPADVALIKSLLDAENITYYFNAEHFMYVQPLAQPVRLTLMFNLAGVGTLSPKGIESEAPRSKMRGIKNQNLVAVVAGTLCNGV